MVNTSTVNPERMEMLTSMLFGRKPALTILSNNPTYRDYSLKRLKELYGTKEQIGTSEFKITDLSTDVHTIADGFGFDKKNLKFVGADDNETFQKLLDVLDMVFAAALVVPMDKIDQVKSGIKMCAQALGKYVPDFKSIGKMLAMAPGISRYSKALISFGECMDHAVDIINRGGENCIRQAIKEMRAGIDGLRDVDIMDINRQVKEAGIKKKDLIETTGTVVDMEEVKEKKEVKKDKKDNTHNSKSKKEETVVSEPMTAETAAMSQQMMPQYMNPEFNQGYIPDTDGSIPEFIRDGADLGKIDPNKSVPDFIAENAMNVPPVTPQQRVFNPVDQNIYLDPRLANYPFVDQILQIANGVGYFMVPELIVDTSNEPLLIFIRIYNSQAYLYDKSFIVDLGKVIDNRYGIWPCANPNGQFNILESCEEAYRLFNKDEKHLNKDFIQAVIQFGFSNLDPKVKKSNILYGFRMTETNRVISLITMPTHIKGTEDLIPAATRNIIRGACIRMSPSLKEYVVNGRFRFVELNHETMEFTLSNENMSSYFMGPVIPHKPVTIKCVPKKDENGNYVPASNKEGGTDIKFDISINS